MLQNSSIYKTLKVFFDRPNRSHSLIDVSRYAELAHTSVRKNLDELINKDIIKLIIEKKGTRKFPIYIANVENKKFRKYKKIYNNISIVNSGLIEFIEEKITPKSIVLFGSYSRGEDDESSDIDLFIECKQEKIDIDRFEKKLNRKIELHFKENFLSFPKELRNNIINGIVLSGYLKAYK